MQLITFLGALSAVGLMRAVTAAPVIEKRQLEVPGSHIAPAAAVAAPAVAKRQINNDDVPGTAIGPPGATGSLYGGEGLLGNAGDSTASPSQLAATSTGTLAVGQTASPDMGFFLDMQPEDVTPQPIRGDEGNTDPGPTSYEYERINSDLLAPPGTDSGSIPNAKWPMALSHNRITTGNAGWARQENTENMPSATAMSGVDMRLQPYAYRELHWHSANEWSYVMRGSCRVAAVNQNGENYVDDVVAGDLWFFPSGVPHSIQALSDGVEFLLVFDQGDFSDDGTSLISEMFLRNPKAVLAKNLRMDVSALDNIPQDQLYIFNGTPPPANISLQNITGPAGYLPSDQSYTYHFSEQAPYEVPGGSVKIADPTTFPIANNFSAALVVVEPGAMREIHWHLTSDEWNFFLQGEARMTIFSAPESSGTFDYRAGDVGYIPVTQSHYIENTGTEDVIFLEVLQAPKFTDISVNQWLGLTPPQIIEDHLHLPASVIASLPKIKPYIIPGPTNTTATNFTGNPL